MRREIQWMCIGSEEGAGERRTEEARKGFEEQQARRKRTETAEDVT